MDRYFCQANKAEVEQLHGLLSALQREKEGTTGRKGAILERALISDGPIGRRCTARARSLPPSAKCPCDVTDAQREWVAHARGTSDEKGIRVSCWGRDRCQFDPTRKGFLCPSIMAENSMSRGERESDPPL